MDSLYWQEWREAFYSIKIRHSSSTSSFTVWPIFGYCCCCRYCCNNVFVLLSPKKARVQYATSQKRKFESPNLAIMINFTFNGWKQPTNYHNYAYIYPISFIIIFWQRFESRHKERTVRVRGYAADWWTHFVVRLKLIGQRLWNVGSAGFCFFNPFFYNLRERMDYI